MSEMNLVVAGDVASQLGALIPTENDLQNLKTLAAMNYLPSLQIASGKSAIVEVQHLAAAGDFVVGKTTYGTVLNVIPVTFRSKAQIYDKGAKKVVSSVVLPAGSGDLKRSPAWVNLSKQSLRPKEEYQYGIEMLLFLPQQELFALFYCKKTLREAGEMLWSYAGQQVSIETYLHTGTENNWHKFKSEPTGECLIGWPQVLHNCEPTIVVNPERLAEALKMFTTVDKTVTTDEDESFAR